ncbi:MAG: hypothetical protein AAGB00_00255 [Planctomycetota bacterium]
MFVTSVLRASAASIVGLAWAGLASGQADPPYIQVDTEIVSLDLTFEGVLPLGPGGTGVNTRVTMAEGEDYNSSRSNRTSGRQAVDPPPPIDPGALEGVQMDFISEIDLRFGLLFEDIDTVNDFDQAIDVSPSGGVLESAVLVSSPSVDFSIASDDFCPRGCILEAPVGEHNGHVTILKIAFGGGGTGGGYDVDLQAAGIDLALTPGTSSYLELPNGDVEHTVDVTMALTGDLNGIPLFVGTTFSGTMVERGTYVNAIIPEPATTALAAWAALACPRRRRR